MSLLNPLTLFGAENNINLLIIKIMDKTIKINLSGILFRIDEDAYKILRDYLKKLNDHFINTPGGKEIIDDIESRIAELFQSLQGMAGVITRDNVELMINTIGMPEVFDHAEKSAGSRGNSPTGRRLWRDPENKIISGVCGGVGAYFGIDPVWIRLIFIILTIAWGISLLIYIGMWIALPSAKTPAEKRELYGDDRFYTYSGEKGYHKRPGSGDSAGYGSYSGDSRVGSFLGEMFHIFGRVVFIFFRIILIITGVLLLLTAFIFILSFVMIFILKYPGIVSTDAMDFNFSILPDFLDFIVKPEIKPWLLALLSMVIILPLIGIIYWSLKMIFWFRARDGIFSLVAILLWVLSLTALVLLLFEEGFSFAERGKSVSQMIIGNPPDTVFVVTGKKSSDLHIAKEINIFEGNYNVFIADNTNELFIKPLLNINVSEDGSGKLEITRSCSDRTRSGAVEKAESLIFNCSMNNDTLLLDEYFSVPGGKRWTADNIKINLSLPEGKVVCFDGNSEKMFNHFVDASGKSHEYKKINQHGRSYWIVAGDGLKAGEKAVQQK
jgi:phage shock protein PspC (stress-responsive transcriptional regulator)